MKKESEAENTASALDFVLNDIIEQIKNSKNEQKELNYTKLIELFFKGLDLKDKIDSAYNLPQAKISGIKDFDPSKI